jgi:hypothetical protein
MLLCLLKFVKGEVNTMNSVAIAFRMSSLALLVGWNFLIRIALCIPVLLLKKGQMRAIATRTHQRFFE